MSIHVMISALSSVLGKFLSFFLHWILTSIVVEKSAVVPLPMPEIEVVH